MNSASLNKWLGKTETRHDHVTVPMVERMAATLDRDDPLPRPGDILPIGWHSLLFPRIARRSMVGRDGHPKLGDFLPPMPLPRRMFAGRRTQFIAPLVIGGEIKAGTPQFAMYGFAAFYAVCLVINWWFYLRANAYVKNP